MPLRDTLVASDLVICMPLLRRGATTDLTKCARTLASVDGTAEINSSEDHCTATINGDGLLMLLMPVHMPDTGSAAMPWADDRPELVAPIRQSDAHLIVTYQPNRDLTMRARVQRLQMLCRAVASVCIDLDAPGVYWGGAGVIWPTEFWVEWANQDEPPYPAWIWFKCLPRRWPRRGTVVRSSGLETLGHVEVERLTNDSDGPTDIEMVLDAAVYLAENGPVIQHGHTFGRSEDERRKVTIGKSLAERGKRALVLG